MVRKLGGFVRVGILMKEEIFANVAEVRRTSDRVIAIVLSLGKKMLCIICVCGP